jgi:hypothetical protein
MRQSASGEVPTHTSQTGVRPGTRTGLRPEQAWSHLNGQGLKRVAEPEDQQVT